MNFFLVLFEVEVEGFGGFCSVVVADVVDGKSGSGFACSSSGDEPNMSSSVFVVISVSVCASAGAVGICFGEVDDDEDILICV